MGYNAPSIFVIAVLIFGSAACSNKNTATSDLPETQSLTENTPELVMDRLRLQYYGDTGLQWELSTPKANGFSSKNFMEAKDLTITLFDHDEKSTTITADEGLLNTAEYNPQDPLNPVTMRPGITLDRGDMYMSGNVVAVSTDGVKLQTDWLFYRRAVDLIKSTAPVQVTRPDSITNGRGFEATSDLQNVTIFNQTLVIRNSTETAKPEEDPATEKNEK